ncbi:carbonic anhydrase 14 [Drosophila persimilis]|uniref:carbonic anhydrase 14 n=1 Tax=Drosophila persimilis TaxID=7234 RepID=UPI000F094D6F|nr:carbonic anhydrase 14 [Drosophila persimilis]
MYHPLPALGCLLLLVVFTCSSALIHISEEYLTAIRLDQADDQAAGDYNYDQQGDDWEGLCQTGQAQSPIALNVEETEDMYVPRIRFHYYNETLQTPLVLMNNGHTANMVIPPTQLGPRAYINGALLPGNFEAQSVHFHWGSRNSSGVEHLVNYNIEKAQVEMHIVHKNTRYATTSEASKHRDGLAVLGVLIRPGRRQNPRNSGLTKIFNRVPRIVQYNTNATINGRLEVAQLLGSVVTGEFFTYNGSLTTPDCAEAVTWIVFPDVLELQYRLIERLFNLRDSRSRPLINNYRDLQDTNGRPIYYRRLPDLPNLL